VAATRPATSRRATISVVLVVAGLLLCVLYRVTSGSEQHSFATGAVAPFDVSVTKGHSYSIGYPGGVDREVALGVDPVQLTCTESQTNGASTRMAITAEQVGTKATNQIATFVSPVTGPVHIACQGLTSVFVDNSDDARTDFSGFFLLLGTIALALGLPLMLSVLRRPLGQSVDRARDEHEIER
jgi:hypothetical protein